MNLVFGVCFFFLRVVFSVITLGLYSRVLCAYLCTWVTLSLESSSIHRASMHCAATKCDLPGERKTSLHLYLTTKQREIYFEICVSFVK